MRVTTGLPQSLQSVFWGMFFIEATFGAYLSVWPLYIGKLGASVAIVGLMLGASGFLRLLVLAPSAAIADRIGYRRAILAARMIAGLGFVTAALATHWTQLGLMLICSAIGELVFPLIQSLVAEQAGENRLRAFALVFTVGPSIALFLSPLIAGLVVAFFGMRAAFVFAAICTVVSLFSLRNIVEPPGLKRTSESPKSTYRDAFNDPGMRLVGGLLLVTVFTLALGISFVPTLLEDESGFSPALIATMSATAALGSATFGVAVARLKAFQQSPFFAVAIAVCATGVGLVIFQSTAVVPILVLGFFFRGGLFSAWAMLNAALGEIAPADHRARAFALAEMAGGIAFSLGPIVAGPLYARRPTLPMEIAVFLIVLLIPLLGFAQRRADIIHPRNNQIVIATGV